VDIAIPSLAVPYPTTGHITIRYRFVSDDPAETLTWTADCYGQPLAGSGPEYTAASADEWEI